MKEMIRIRVFERKDARYYLASSEVEGMIGLESYVVSQMEEGYFPMDFISFGVDLLRVVFNYSPASCEKFRNHADGVSDLVNMKSGEGV